MYIPSMNNDTLQISPKIQDFLSSHGYNDLTVTPIAGAGSGRQYFRIESGDRSSVLQISAEVNDDFKRFVEYSRTLRDFSLPVTRVYAVDEDSCQILQEDLGKRTLLDEVVVNGQVNAGSARILYPVVIDALLKWQNTKRWLQSAK